MQSLESRRETVEGDQAQFIEALTPPRFVEELEHLNERGQRNAYPRYYDETPPKNWMARSVLLAG